MILHTEVLSPEKVIYSGDISEIQVPTTTGDITILPQHMSLLSTIRPGELILKHDGKQEYFAISGGYVEVTKDVVTILAEFAIHSENIDAIKAEEAKKRAEKLMQEKLSEEDFAMAQSELRKSIVQLQVVQRRRRNRTLRV